MERSLIPDLIARPAVSLVINCKICDKHMLRANTQGDMLTTSVFCPFCSMKSYLEGDLKMGEENTEDVSITVSDQNLGQLKAGREGWRGSLCCCVWSVI